MTFTWTSGTGAQNYWLDVGNAFLTAEYATGAVTTTSKSVSGLPCEARSNVYNVRAGKIVLCYRATCKARRKRTLDHEYRSAIADP